MYAVSVFLLVMVLEVKEFIEAHHTIPLESLSPGDETKIEDIALVCSNCHSMIHRGNTLNIIELRNKLH